MEKMDNEKGLECFVAMWFGSDDDSRAEMDQLYDVVIKPAVQQHGLVSYHVGRDLGADRLDVDILAAIDRAVLVVVALTHDEQTGFRGSVVFEAGYAYKTKPVVWMCRNDIANTVPFDMRQFRQIRWVGNKLTQARDDLAGVIGDRIRSRQKEKADHEVTLLISESWKKMMLWNPDRSLFGPRSGTIITRDERDLRSFWTFVTTSLHG